MQTIMQPGVTALPAAATDTPLLPASHFIDGRFRVTDAGRFLTTFSKKDITFSFVDALKKGDPAAIAALAVYAINSDSSALMGMVMAQYSVKLLSTETAAVSERLAEEGMEIRQKKNGSVVAKWNKTSVPLARLPTKEEEQTREQEIRRSLSEKLITDITNIILEYDGERFQFSVDNVRDVIIKALRKSNYPKIEALLRYASKNKKIHVLTGGLDRARQNILSSKIPAIKLVGLDLRGFNLQNFVLYDVEFVKTDFSRTDLSCVIMRRVQVIDCNIVDTNFGKATLNNVLFRSSKFRGKTNLNGAVLQNCTFDHSPIGFGTGINRTRFCGCEFCYSSILTEDVSDSSFAEVCLENSFFGFNQMISKTVMENVQGLDPVTASILQTVSSVLIDQQGGRSRQRIL